METTAARYTSGGPRPAWLPRFQGVVAAAHAGQCIAAGVLINHWGPGYGAIRWLDSQCWAWPFVWLLPAFAACSAIAHALTAAYPPEGNVNAIRWVEYAVSSGLCNWVVCTLVGIEEILALVAITLINAAMMGTGWMVEVRMVSGSVRDAKRWLWAGWALFVLVWGPILGMFARAVATSAKGVPTAVIYGVPIGLVAINGLFGAWMLAYVYGFWPLGVRDISKRFWRAEVGYSILSLTAKSYLMWFELGGAQRPRETVC